MTRMQRYIFGQTFRTLLLIVGGLVVLSLLAQGLSRTDLIVESRQSALVYFKVVALGAPQVVSLLLPIALFIASVWTLNRIHRDSEIVVVQSVGMTGWQVASPLLRLAVLATLAHLAVNLWGQPLAQAELRETLKSAQQDLVATLVREGRFTRSDELTIYIESNDSGVLRGVYIADLSTAGDPVDFVANSGSVAEIAGQPALLMRDGQILQLDIDGALTVLDFDQYAFSLAQFAGDDSDLVLKASDRTLDRLFAIDELNYFEVSNADEFRAEGHARLSAPLMNIVMAVIAIVTILGGDFNRQGYGRRIMWGSAAALLFLILHIVASNEAANDVALIPVMWAVPALGVLAPPLASSIGRLRASGRLKRVNKALPRQAAPA